jgi:hypothetical protein
MARIYLDARAVSGRHVRRERYCRGLIPELAAFERPGTSCHSSLAEHSERTVCIVGECA